MSVLPSLKRSQCQTQIEVSFAGERIILDASGAIMLPAQDVLVVSDLHLEKGSFFAARGNPIPCHDTGDTLQRLAELIDCYRPRTVLSLGDSFHDVRAGDRISPKNARLLTEIVRSVTEWTWITGNHDPKIPTRFHGHVASDYRLAPISFSHRPEDGAAPRIAGHYHPKHRLRTARRSISGPCFVVGADLLLLPAFGAYAGGLSTSSEPLQSLFETDLKQHVMIYGGKLWALE